MLLAYVDESYTTAQYYVAALVVPGTSVPSLTAALDNVVWKATIDHGGVHPTTELHGNSLVGGKDGWKPLAQKIRARVGVYMNAVSVIADHDVVVIVRGVDIVGLRRRYTHPDPPHSVALTHLIERVDEYAEAQGELALMIADEVSGQDAHRRSLWEYQRTATWGYRSRRITRVIDTIHFAPSSSSRLVQAADLIAYLYRRKAAHGETDPRAAKAFADLWDRISPRVHHAMCWYP